MNDSQSISAVIIEAALMLGFPLAGFLLLRILPGRMKHMAGRILSFLMLCNAIVSVHLAWAMWSREPVTYHINWFTIAKGVSFDAGILLDRKTVMMLVTVAVISFFVSVFSLSYMKGDEGEKRYFANLGLFVFSMTGIVISDNLLLLFCFWELVGVSSYLLINHWFQEGNPPRAATKAFIVNRVGDAAFLVGIGIAWSLFHTLDFTGLYDAMANVNQAEASAGLISFMGICLFLGAAGKSAQFPFQAWLPDAMAGPTPVSALIHAATMVAAGVFLLARIFPLLAPGVLTIIAVAGAITAFMGAIAAMTQFDIKKVLAFSTISQLGYMVMGMGVGAYDAALFHLFTHAFFKAGLFLAAGAIIHAMHVYLHDTPGADAQDMRNMGGLHRRMPLIFYSFVILAFALAGIPFFSGYLSKEAILVGSFAWAEAMGGGQLSVYHILPFSGMVTVALTAYYMARQVYLVFLGSPRFTTLSAGKFPFKAAMAGPVVVLSLCSIGFLWSLNPFSFTGSWFFPALEIPRILVPGIPDGFQQLLADLSEKNHMIIFLISSAMILTGAVLAWFRYRLGTQAIGHRPGFFYRLSSENWWMDNVYQYAVVRPVSYIAGITYLTDRKVLDGLIHRLAVGGVILSKIVAWTDKQVVDGLVNFTARTGHRIGDVFRSVQGGNVQRYVAAAILLMIVLFWLIY